MAQFTCSLIPYDRSAQLLEFDELCPGLNLATWMEFIYARIGFALVCHADNHPAGIMLVLRKTEPNFQVQHAFVAPPWREHEVGPRLLQFACGILPQTGARRLYLYELPTRQLAGIAPADFANLGFTLSGYARHAFRLHAQEGPGLPALIQQLESRYHRFLKLPDHVKLLPVGQWPAALWRVFTLQSGHAYPIDFFPGDSDKFASGNPSFALVTADQPVGWIIYRPLPNDELLLDSLFLKPEWRKPAWCLILILASLKALTHASQSVRLFVDDGNRLMLPIMDRFAALITSRQRVTEYHREIGGKDA